MHTVELMEHALLAAEQLGYGIRHEYLGGSGGGGCEIAGKKWLFVDLALNLIEQLDQVVETLGEDPQIHTIELPGPLQEAIAMRRCA